MLALRERHIRPPLRANTDWRCQGRSVIVKHNVAIAAWRMTCVSPSLFVAVSAVLAGSCREGPALALDGVWQTFPVPGSSTILTLTQHDTVVTGTGTWSGEACCSGTLTVAGTYLRPRVALTLSYGNGWVGLYSGTVVDASHMLGTEAFNGGSTDTVTFTKR